MGFYETMQVCLKGHLITERYNSYPQHRKDFCGECGAKTIFRCLQCGENIRGDYIVSGVIGGGRPAVVLHCHKCGNGYPWAKRLKFLKATESVVSPVKFVVETISRLKSP